MQSEWYKNLNKSPLNPPAGVFPPVWFILYVMIGLSLWFYVRDGFLSSKILGLAVFALQMILNFNWSKIFFKNHDINGAFRKMVLMWILIGMNIYLFYQHSELAAYLLIPYFLWVSFALYLNYYIVKNN